METNLPSPCLDLCELTGGYCLDQMMVCAETAGLLHVCHFQGELMVFPGHAGGCRCREDRGWWKPHCMQCSVNLKQIQVFFFRVSNHPATSTSSKREVVWLALPFLYCIVTEHLLPWFFCIPFGFLRVCCRSHGPFRSMIWYVYCIYFISFSHGVFPLVNHPQFYNDATNHQNMGGFLLLD